MRGDTQAAVEADQIVRQAREQASRIVAEARSQAARPDLAPATVRGRTAAGAAGSRAALGRVVARERDFLQNLATLIQDHARALKEDLAAVRSPVQAESTSAEQTHRAAIEPEPGPTEGRPPSSGVPSEGPSGAGEPQSERTESEPAWSKPPEAEPPPWAPREDPSPSQPEAQGTPEDSTRTWDSLLDSADREGAPPAKGPSPGTVVQLGPSGAVLDEDDPTGHQGGATPTLAEAPESTFPRDVANQPIERAGLGEDSWRPEQDEGEQQDRSVRELFWGED